MREIKFRGKAVADIAGIIDPTKKGDWVYGNLVVNGSEYWIIGPIVEVDEEYINFEYWIRVEPETVGQHTGLKDEDGAEIYEGDIVNSTTGLNRAYLREVVKIEDRPELRFKPSSGLSLCDANSKSFGVVGNVHENPELSK